MSNAGRFLAPLCGLLLVAASCSGARGGEASETTAVSDDPTTSAAEAEETTPAQEEVLEIESRPGELVWVHDREPPDLHLDDPANNTDIAAWIRQGLLEGLFGVDRTISYYPELLAREPVISAADRGGSVRIEYELRPGLTWSDGMPLTSADVAYTHAIIVEGCDFEADGSIVDSTNVGCEYDMAARIGYELVTEFETIDPTRFAVTMASFFPGWRDLYDEIYAAHAFGADAFALNQNLRRWDNGQEVLPSSGPLLFESWTPGRSIVLGRNEAYHGSVSPDAVNTGPVHVDGIRIAFVVDVESQVALLSTGQAHLLMAPAQRELLPLASSEGFTVASSPSPVYEHWGLNLLNPHLAKPQVREAVAYAIDKVEMVSQIYQPLFGEAVPPAGLGNAYWMTNQAGYVDHQDGYAGNNVTAAAAALRSVDYEPGSDGIWTHPVDGRLSLRAGTTGGNDMRDALLELGRDQLQRAGIEIEIDSAPGGLFYTEGPFAPEALAASASAGREGDPRLWDIAQFSWSSGPWPGGVSGIFRSGSVSNPYGFNNPEFDVAASDCDAIQADIERAQCYNALDTFVTTLNQGEDGLFVIPLTQRPHVYGYANDLVGSAAVAPDLPRGGPLVNATDFMLVE